MTIVDDVRQVIAKALKVPVEEIKPEARLEDIGAESLDVLEIVFELEERFGISIPFQANQAGKSADAAKLPFDTITDVANAVQTLVDAKAGP